MLKFYSPVQFYRIFFAFFKYFVQYCLGKQIFDQNSVQPSPNFSFFDAFYNFEAILQP